MVVRHVYTSPRGIPVKMSVVPPYTSDVSYLYKNYFTHILKLYV